MMDDYKPRKQVSPTRISRIPTYPQITDVEIGDAFVPPEKLALEDEKATTIPDGSTKIGAITEPKTDEVHKSFVPTTKLLKNKWRWWPIKSWVRKQWYLAVAVVVFLIASVGLSYFVFGRPVKKASRPAVVIAKPVIPTKPITTPSRLTGLPVSSAQSVLPVTGIMIENSLDARPQSGLDQAGVVYEAVAEGGITRFLSLFEDSQPEYVGPVRSARPYYLRWLLPFDASYAHVGGSPNALADIRALRIKDLDQFYNGDSYRRISSRAAPHNVYTSLAKLLTLEQAKKYDSSTFTGFLRKPEAPIHSPTASSIDFTISGPVFSVHYTYDQASNSYLRSEGGAPHVVIDEKGTQTQLKPKVVIALVIPQSNVGSTSQGASYTQYSTIGSGQMYVFQDGEVTAGTWSKTDDTSQFVFTDNAAAKPLALNPGQTWISVVGLNGDVSYK
ncbi:MAG: hypothetical protein NVS1B7_6120 [Candidatus Saccharimonadales bacterium]